MSLYRIRRHYQTLGENLTFEQLRELMLTIDARPNYQMRVLNANKAYSEQYDSYALNWIAIDFETIGSIKPMDYNP